MWNSLELFQEYYNSSFCVYTGQVTLVDVLRHQFVGELLVLSSLGIASIVAFRTNTVHALKPVKDDEEDDIPRSISKIGKQVAKGCKALVRDKASYNTHIDKHRATESVSSALQALLTVVCPNLDQSLPALLIGNIVTSLVNSEPTNLQIALGVLMRDSKDLLSHMYDYRITCSYDEIMHFKKSAAVAAANNLSQQGLSEAKSRLHVVQVVSDNYDIDISSSNGKLSTHSLAIIIMQRETGNEKSRGQSTNT